MKKVTQITCVCCPNHCLVTVDESAEPSTSGNQCPNGAAFAQTELRKGTRQVAGEIRIAGAETDRCTVETSCPVPVGSLPEIGAVLKGYRAEAPVVAGQVLIHQIAGTDADLIAVDSVPKKSGKRF